MHSIVQTNKQLTDSDVSIFLLQYFQHCSAPCFIADPTSLALFMLLCFFILFFESLRLCSHCLVLVLFFLQVLCFLISKTIVFAAIWCLSSLVALFYAFFCLWPQYFSGFSLFFFFSSERPWIAQLPHHSVMLKPLCLTSILSNNIKFGVSKHYVLLSCLATTTQSTKAEKIGKLCKDY